MNTQYRIINSGKGVLNINSINLQRVGLKVEEQFEDSFTNILTNDLRQVGDNVYLSVRDAPVVDVNNLVLGSTGGTSEQPLSSVLNALGVNQVLADIVNNGTTVDNTIDTRITYTNSSPDPLIALIIENTSTNKILLVCEQGLKTSNANSNVLLDVNDPVYGDSTILRYLNSNLVLRDEDATDSGILLTSRISGLNPVNDQDYVTKIFAENNYLNSGGLPTPTQAASTLQNVGGIYVEVLEKRVRFTGANLSLLDGDSQRVLTLPDTNILLETDGFILDVVISGQPRFLTDDYIMLTSNQIRFDFPIKDTDIIRTTYKIEI